MNRLDRKDICMALIVAAAAQVVYLCTLAPTVTSEDSGEFIAAACTTGVAHPPGYPLWCLTAKAFCLIPSSSPAWAINLMSSVFAGLTCALVYLICVQLGSFRLPAVAAALCLAFSRHFWSQAVIAEVYTLNTFLLGAILLSVLLWKERRSDSFLYLASLFFGLGLANHYMLMLLVSPPLIWYVAWDDPALWRRKKVVALCAAIILLSQAVYIYLPLAASAGPAMNWGNPSDWDGFWRHVARTQYRSLELGEAVSPSTKLLFIGHFLRLLWVQFTPYVLVPFGFLGWGFFREAKRERLMLSAMFLLDTVVLILVLRFSFESENMSRMEEYYLPAYMAAAIIVAGGLSRIGEFVRGILPGKAALALALAAPVLPLAANWSSNDMSKYYLAYDYNRVILESLEKDAVYFAAGDFNAFPTVYLQAVEGIRPDVILADITGTLSHPAREYLESLDPDADPLDRKQTQSVMIGRGTRPVYFTAKSDIKDPGSYAVYAWGMVYRVRVKGSPRLEGRLETFGGNILRNTSVPTPLDDMGASILSNYYLMWGEYLAEEGRRNEALARYTKAAEYGETSKEALNNIGATVAERGFTGHAEMFFRKAARLYPAYLTGRRNLARILEEEGKDVDALAVYKQLEQFEPGNESLKRKIASLSRKAGAERPKDLDGMLREFLQAVRDNPANPAAWNNLGNVYAEKGDARKALESFNRAIEADLKYFKVYRNLAVFWRNVMHDENQAAVYMERYQVMKRLEKKGGS